MSLGPLIFTAPLALLALLGLPLLLWVLRASPPPPRRELFPPLRLLEGIAAQEETPAKTPWWVILLRALAISLAIFGLAAPSWAPTPNAVLEDGPLLIVVDDGWASAADWRTAQASVSALIDARAPEGVHLVLTAKGESNLEADQALAPRAARQKISGLAPKPWANDYLSALQTIELIGLPPGPTVWISDGLEGPGRLELANALAARGTLEVRRLSVGPILTGFEEGTSLSANLERFQPDATTRTLVSARAANASPLAASPLDWAAGQSTATVQFDLPVAARGQISRIDINGVRGAGSVLLLGSGKGRPRVGLVDLVGGQDQPLLSDAHYIEKALAPTSDIIRADVGDLIADNPDAIILSDVGRLTQGETSALITWVEAGGVLIRFAGPRLAAQSDGLVPVTLRQGTRSLGGALAWDQPQKLDGFPPASPFAGIVTPSDALIRQQVLAEPDADLAARTWARLEDGTPIVTGAERGQGLIVLFHVTARPDWSDLPYTAAFVSMLERTVSLRGQRLPRADGMGLYTPFRVLDGFGQLEPPDAEISPVQNQDWSTIEAGPYTPPGLYTGPDGMKALNVFRQPPVIAKNWPQNTRLTASAAPDRIALAPPFLFAAGGLLVLDMLLALAFAGRLPGWITARTVHQRARSRAGSSLLALCLCAHVFAPTSEAQSRTSTVPEAALEMRFGFIPSGDGRIDSRTREGLFGLSFALKDRTSVEPGTPVAVNLETDPLDLYPLIYMVISESTPPLTPRAASRLNTYLRSGGALLIDTRDDAIPRGAAETAGPHALERILVGLDLPQIQPVPSDHVLTRAFYIQRDFPGQVSGGTLWIEAVDPASNSGGKVSPVFIGGADWASAWASDEQGRPLYPVEGGERQREYAYRFGINLVMYILTGTYKDDQVHIPALLDRLDK
jgi:hypothetical protein